MLSRFSTIYTVRAQPRRSTSIAQIPAYLFFSLVLANEGYVTVMTAGVVKNVLCSRSISASGLRLCLYWNCLAYAALESTVYTASAFVTTTLNTQTQWDVSFCITSRTPHCSYQVFCSILEKKLHTLATQNRHSHTMPSGARSWQESTLSL